MASHKEILRLKSLGLPHAQIAQRCECGRNTVTRTLQQAQSAGLSWSQARNMTEEETSAKLNPKAPYSSAYQMPDYEYIHQEMQKSGVTLSLLWQEYYSQCRASGKLPYQSTQFTKHYADYVHKTKATMHVDHKPGDTMQVDWAGQTGGIIDTDTGEIIPVYLFVAVLPYSCYAYTEGFLDMKQESWINAHVHAYQYFGGIRTGNRG